jgi:hypothetical protein
MYTRQGFGEYGEDDALGLAPLALAGLASSALKGLFGGGGGHPYDKSMSYVKGYASAASNGNVAAVGQLVDAFQQTQYPEVRNAAIQYLQNLASGQAKFFISGVPTATRTQVSQQAAHVLENLSVANAPVVGASPAYLPPVTSGGLGDFGMLGLAALGVGLFFALNKRGRA